MAYIGLAKPTIAKMSGTGAAPTYESAFACGKAIQMDITPQYAEGSLYGDNIKAEYDKEFKYADVVLNTTTLPVEAHNILFGHTVDEAKSSVTFKGNDAANYVGLGFYVIETVNGVRSYVASWLYKVKFSEGAESYKTKGDNIEYQTPSLNGQAMALDDGKWKETSVFTTETEAQEWIETKSGQTGA